MGDRFRDQTRLTGHQHRIDDLARFAELGISRLRYPVTWERVAPNRADERDWRWSDERLAEIARLGMTPIVGLLHHGSGPRYTSLVDDGFVAGFADHAAATAERYPDVTDWTPVNEPLTTARFSALYGLWYPHARDERSFWGALLNQVDATRAAMKAIRQVNPAARLIQTEDLGQHFSTEPLAPTATYHNHRRWATWDLLTGRFGPDHPLWREVDALGLGDRLRAIADDPCPPDVIGVNYYPTSERFLDHRREAYPYPVPAEGYHDLTAIRVLDPPSPGLEGLLRQAWDRYRIPLAVTESHLGCTREEQLRWLWQAWGTCRDLAADGVDVRALTAWALLGSVDWNSLITAEVGHYESGAFDVRGGGARPTAVARLLAVLGRGEEPDAAAFPTLEGPGWWQRSMRLEHAPFAWTDGSPPPPEVEPAPVLVVAADDAARRAVVGECAMRGLPCVAVEAAGVTGGVMGGVTGDRAVRRPWATVIAAVPVVEAAAIAETCRAEGVRCLWLSCDADPGRAADALTIRTAADGTVPRSIVRAGLDLLIDGERGAWDPAALLLDRVEVGGD